MKKFRTLFVVFIIAIGGYFGYLYWNDNVVTSLENFSCEEIVQLSPDNEDQIREACQLQDNLKNDQERFNNYLEAGLAWKSLADLTQDKEFYDLAIFDYTLANERYDAKYLTSWNLAKIYQTLGDFENAEKYFKLAVDHNNIDAEPYIALADFYRYKKHESKQFLMQFYIDSLNKVSIDSGELLTMFARYLEEEGELELALQQYEKLEEVYPNSFQGAINDIKQKLNN